MRQIFFTTGSHLCGASGGNFAPDPRDADWVARLKSSWGGVFFFGVFSMDLREINGILGWFHEIHISDINIF